LETLVFAASLRLPENIPQLLKVSRANQVLQQLRLEHVANTRIGSTEHRGISGGESRRVSIGVELVAAPDVLVLDEPTSGLDSVSASRLITLLKNLAAESGTTIIASIHQPSSALYRAFDQVVLLANGRQLYVGPGGDRPAEFFAKQGRPCPPGYNVADHLLEIASGTGDGLVTGRDAYLSSSTGAAPGSSGESSEEDELSGRYTADHSETPFAEKDLSGMTYPPHSLSKNGGGGDMAVSFNDDHSRNGKREWWPRSHCATTFLTQIEVLSGREWRNLKR
jgi:ABC-type multidrug transport system ATPase subunit